MTWVPEWLGSSGGAWLVLITALPRDVAWFEMGFGRRELAFEGVDISLRRKVSFPWGLYRGIQRVLL